MMLKARFVAPVTSPVIENGAIIVHGGLITAVGAARDLSDESVVDYGEAILCPGFVSARCMQMRTPSSFAFFAHAISASGSTV